MSLDPRLEIAVKNTLAQVLPNLTDVQIQATIRRFTKLVDKGEPEDYSFVEAIKRYKCSR